MNSTRPRQYLLDVNALIALVDPDHKHYQTMQSWFDSLGGGKWGICPLTEMGFIRVTTNPAYPISLTMDQAIAALTGLRKLRGYSYWGMAYPWLELAAPFRKLLFGHQQVTDSYLLGLAVKEGGILVTLDRAMKYLAGTDYSHHLLVLE